MDNHNTANLCLVMDNHNTANLCNTTDQQLTVMLNIQCSFCKLIHIPVL